MLDNIFNLVAIALGVYGAYRLGLRAYKRQKSIEECRHKYIDEGIEALHTELSEGFASFNRNWQIAHSLIRIVRDYRLDNLISIDESDIKFYEFEPKNLGAKYYYKVNELLGNDVAQKWSLAFFSQLSGYRILYFKQDLGLNIKEFINTENKNPKLCKEFYDKSYEELEIWKKEIYKNLFLIVKLEEVLKILRKKQISYETLPKVREDKEIVNIVRQLNDELEKIHPREKVA